MTTPVISNDDERPLKKLKISEEDGKKDIVELPAEVWALVSHFLPYVDVMNIAAVNKMFLIDVMQSISRIHLFRSKELNGKHARRLPRVERVYIYSLLKKPPPEQTNMPRAPLFPPERIGLEYCTETKYRVVPFLSYFLKLRYVFLGAMCFWEERKREVWDGSSKVALKNCKPSRIAHGDRGTNGHRTLVHAFCGAFATGSLSKRFRIDGLFHARAANLCPNMLPMFPPRRAQHCSACNHVLMHFPSEWLIQARGNFLCVPAKKRMQQVITRGHAKLFKEDRVIKKLIEDGIRDQIFPSIIGIRGTGERLRPIGMTNATLNDLRALIELELLDPKSVDPSIFYNRLKKVSTRVNPRAGAQRAAEFSKRDFQALASLGFPLEEEALQNEGITLFEAPDRHPPHNLMPGLEGLEGFLNHIGEQMGAGDEGGVEVNIEAGPEMEPLYANIFNRVRDVVREQLGDDHAERFGDLHDQVLGRNERRDNAGDQVNGGQPQDNNIPNRPVLRGGIVMGGFIGHPHIAMGFGGPQLAFPGMPRPPAAPEQNEGGEIARVVPDGRVVVREGGLVVNVPERENE
eukprot:CAMPEP_0178903302 /NCGR_PEP_ID=MMETSP0786-20121207/5083_1 /TAXON_ID=186022 /ORGANISM="Thalassionema frauenfeldii, Strain CCMP 1798" /LENGTH=573 /DNA_ID=CAMNT_0020574661 /DNA_START=43 /DNA_END=1767 /DNA_ORIENTATION=+